jgi:hypothetical protein
LRGLYRQNCRDGSYLINWPQHLGNVAATARGSCLDDWMTPLTGRRFLSALTATVLVLAIACGSNDPPSSSELALSDGAIELTRVAGLIAPTAPFVTDESAQWWALRGLSFRPAPDALDLSSLELTGSVVESLWTDHLADSMILGQFDQRARLEMCGDGSGKVLDEESPLLGERFTWIVERDVEQIGGMRTPNDFPEWNAVLIRTEFAGGENLSTDSHLRALVGALSPNVDDVYRLGQRIEGYDYPDGPDWFALGPVTFAHQEWLVMDQPGCGK